MLIRSSQTKDFVKFLSLVVILYLGRHFIRPAKVVFRLQHMLNRVSDDIRTAGQRHIYSSGNGVLCRNAPLNLGARLSLLADPTAVLDPGQGVLRRKSAVRRLQVPVRMLTL